MLTGYKQEKRLLIELSDHRIMELAAYAEMTRLFQ